MDIIIITGKVNSGKTSLMKELVQKEKDAGSSPTGIIAPGIFKAGIKTGYDAKDLTTGRRIRLARLNSTGKFVFYKKGFESSGRALLHFTDPGIVFLDEVGPLELKEKGHAESLRILLDSGLDRLYLSVRDSCLEEVKKRFLSRKKHRITVMKVKDTSC
ncbi:MAG: nucleoside-triphosphatase [bacterium]|nr:nucleoside-triphosphatase [bacterium]